MKIPVLIFVLYFFLFPGCKTGSKATIENILEAQRQLMPPASIIKMQKNGTDLFAKGDAPSDWSIEMDYDKLIVFKSADGTSVSVLPSFSKKEITTVIETYEIRTDQGLMIIRIFNSGCGGQQMSRKVEVDLPGRQYTGCGNYLYDHRLNDIWVLDMVNNIKQQPPDFTKGLPTLQFDLQKNKMTGTDGCNSIGSAIETQGNRIKFSPFTSTKMACNNNKVEKIFSEMLSNNLVDYYEENGNLVLYLVDDSKLVFKRKSL